MRRQAMLSDPNRPGTAPTPAPPGSRAGPPGAESGFCSIVGRNSYGPRWAPTPNNTRNAPIMHPLFKVFHPKRLCSYSKLDARHAPSHSVTIKRARAAGAP
ncbi:unnamed protein product [Boreogadus saida]